VVSVHNISIYEKLDSLITRFQKKKSILDIYVLQREGLFYAGSKTEPEVTEVISPMVASIMSTTSQLNQFLQIEDSTWTVFTGKLHSIIIIPFGESFLLMLKVKTRGYSKKLKKYIYNNVRSLNTWLETHI
jgi:predicted regulator of Ras-like GTPase activity (Roadblock/LC7/MglB family)